MKRWCLSASVRLWLLISFSGFLSIFTALSVRAEEKPSRQDVETTYITSSTIEHQIGSTIPQLSEIQLPATSATMLVQAPAPTNTPNPEQRSGAQAVAITGVKANPTEKGVE